MRLLYLEPFDAGSHAAFTRTVTRGIDARWTVLTLPGRFWKWRMRSCAAHWSLTERAALAAGHDAILASAYVPLAELRGLVPELARCPALLYFHENQAAYPDPRGQPRDHHFALTQLVSCLAADRIGFNSNYNRDSLLDHGARLLRAMPERSPDGWLEHVRARAVVLGYPCAFSAEEDQQAPAPEVPPGAARGAGPLLLWNHRWEHDKDPAAFFTALDHLVTRGVAFRVAVCGQSFRQVPPEFAAARARLGDRVVQWGELPEVDYHQLLGRCQLVVSTARHEFFGVAVLEAVHAGARALVPDRLSYPQLVPAGWRYPDNAALADTLGDLCTQWTRGEIDLRGDHRELSWPHAAAVVLPVLAQELRELARGRRG